MESMTILGGRQIDRPAFTPGQGQLTGPFALFDAAAPPHPAESVMRWRVSAVGYGRDLPTQRRTLEVETPLTATREELRAIVERGSREDYANWRAGD